MAAPQTRNRAVHHFLTRFASVATGRGIQPNELANEMFGVPDGAGIHASLRDGHWTPDIATLGWLYEELDDSLLRHTIQAEGFRRLYDALEPLLPRVLAGEPFQ